MAQSNSLFVQLRALFSFTLQLELARLGQLQRRQRWWCGPLVGRIPGQAAAMASPLPQVMLSPAAGFEDNLGEHHALARPVHMYGHVDDGDVELGQASTSAVASPNMILFAHTASPADAIHLLGLQVAAVRTCAKAAIKSTRCSQAMHQGRVGGGTHSRVGGHPLEQRMHSYN